MPSLYELPANVCDADGGDPFQPLLVVNRQKDFTTMNVNSCYICLFDSGQLKYHGLNDSFHSWDNIAVGSNYAGMDNARHCL